MKRPASVRASRFGQERLLAKVRFRVFSLCTQVADNISH